MRAVTITALTVITLAASMSPAVAGSTSGSAPNGASITVTANDYILENPDCQKFPVTVTFTNIPADDSYTGVIGEARVPGSNEDIGVGESATSTGSSTIQGESQVCPGLHPSGTYTAIMQLNSGGTKTIIPTPLTFTIRPATANITVITKRARTGTKVTVKGTVPSRNGALGLKGSYEVAFMTPKGLGGNGKWRTMSPSLYPDSFGAASETFPVAIPKGSSVRVTPNCSDDYCTRVATTVKVR